MVGIPGIPQFMAMLYSEDKDEQPLEIIRN